MDDTNIATERVLSLDVSSKTGWAFMVSGGNSIELIDYGILPQIHEPEGTYPGNYVDWAYACFGQIEELIDRFAPDSLVIEETVAGSKSVYSQKFLEFCHFLLAKFIRDTRIKATYMLTGAWRSEVGCKMTKEESKHNKSVRAYKAEHNNTTVAYDISGKRIGKLTKKHINVRRANEVFGLDFKIGQNDMADAILMGYAYHLRAYGQKKT